MPARSALNRLLTATVPPRARQWLRGRAAVRRAYSLVVGRVASRPLPGTPYTLFFDPSRHAVFAAHDLDSCEADERRVALECLRQRNPKVLWDVGANVGLWTLWLSAVAGPDASIVSFEPDSANLEFLRRASTENRLPHHTIRPVAVSDSTGQATFYSDPVTGATGSLQADESFTARHFGARNPPVTIFTTTIDQEVSDGLPAPDFMKIDVEGHELAVLRGGERTLAEFRPVLLFEATQCGDEVAALLHRLGYRMFDTEMRPIAMPAYFTAALPTSS